MSTLCEQPADILYNICSLSDDRSMTLLAACSSGLRSTIYGSILKRVCLPQISSYSSEEEALNILSEVRNPISLYRWGLYIPKMDEESLRIVSDILLSSLSSHLIAMGVEIWKQKGFDVYSVLVSLIKTGGEHKIGAVRYLLSLYNWIGYSSYLAPLLRQSNLHGMLGLIGVQDDLPVERLDSFHYLQEYREFKVPMELQPGFYLASKEIIGIHSHSFLFWKSYILQRICRRIYYQVEHHPVPDPVYRYSMKLKNLNEVTSIIYFDDLDLIRGMRLFCQTIEMDWEEVCMEVRDHVRGRIVEV